MKAIGQTLKQKFFIGMSAGLLISSIVFAGLYLSQYNHQLNMERAQAASHINNLLKTILENLMLKRDLIGLDDVVKRLGAQPSIIDVFITNPKGEIRFSSNPSLLGQKLQPDPVLFKTTSPLSRFTSNNQGNDVFRSINPVRNKTECEQCHGSRILNPVNGILYVDFDGKTLRKKASDTTFYLLGSGALIVIINLIGGWWFFNRFVLKPINRLTQNSENLKEGQLESRVKLPGNDELSYLGETLDEMAANLQNKINELENHQAFLQSLIDAIPDGVRIIDQEYRVRLTNKAYQEQLKASQSHVGKFCYQCSHNSQQPCAPTLITCPIHEVKKHGKPVKTLHRHIKEDGSQSNVEIYAAPMLAKLNNQSQSLIVESIRDLDKSVKYSHEQRLSELGILASGVAHEIHNPLASIRLALDASKNKLEQKEACHEIFEYLSLVDKEIDKCIEVTHRLLKLSTPPGYAEIVHVVPLLQDTISLLNWEARSNNININFEYDGDPRILATESDLGMVALNIIQNAFHAMPLGGELSVQAKTENDEIVISFSDTGVGIAKDEIPHIFDPFFSQRADNFSGTGLGLSISHNIVTSYKGYFSIESELGKGSTFTLHFPDANKEA